MRSLGSLGLGSKDFPGSYCWEAHTLQSLNPLSLSTDTALYSGRAHPMMMYGTCQCPWGKSLQKLLQVLAIATSRVDMSQHQTTCNFFLLCAGKNDFYWQGFRCIEDYILFTRHYAIVFFCEIELFLPFVQKPSKHLPYFLSGNKKAI